MEVELYLFRHGEAGTRLPISAKDEERPLTAAGKDEVEGAGRGIAEMALDFDLIASSPLKRAAETAFILNKALKRRATVEEWAELKPEGSRSAFYRRLGRLKPSSSVLCVGHEPYLSTAVGEMTAIDGEGSLGFRMVLKKSGMVRITVTSFNPRIKGELRWLLTPKQLRKLG